MIHKLSIKFRAIAVVMSLLVAFSSCKKDKQQAELTLDKNTVEMFAGDKMPVNISSGNGDYSVSSSSDAIAAASLAGQTINIDAKTRGTATITVRDGAGRTATITVNVKSAIIDATTPRFKWTNTVELNKPNGWATAIMSGKIAMTNIVEKKQYILIWTGDYNIGNKTGAKLRIVESGKTTEEIALTDLEVQKAENNLYSIIFSKDTQKGELVIANN